MRNPIVRRNALTLALALAISQASAAPVDTRSSVAGHRQDLDTLALVAANPSFLLLRSGAYDPASERLDLSRSALIAPGVSANYAIIQFSPATLDTGRKALLASGAEIVGYVPNNGFFVRLNGNDPATLRSATGARATEYYANALKVDPRLWMDARSNLLKQQTESIAHAAVLDIIDIRAFRGESSARIEAILKKLVPGVQITGRSQRAEAAPYVHAGVAREQLDSLIQAAAQIDGVASVEPWLPTETSNSAAIGAIQGNMLTTTCAGSGPVCLPTPMFDQGLFGTGQIVAVVDSGTNPWLANFTTLDRGSGPQTLITASDSPPPVLPAIGSLYPERKVLAYWLQPTVGDTGPVDYDYASGHGTHVAGTVLGDLAGTFNGTTYHASSPGTLNHEMADGMAPNAQLIMQDAGGTNARSVYVNDFAGTMLQAFAGGARVQNNSWGSSTHGIYSGNDADADQVTWSVEDLLVVVAAGNDDPGPTQTGSPSNAKNVLSVAALGRAGSTAVAGFSNRGPAADGRQKPDISAPGSAIQSARTTSTFSAVPVYTTPRPDSGTSMASPVIAGNAALVRQYFADGFYPRGTRTSADAYNPSGMVTKAVLLNGTNALGGTNWPSADSGWGRAWLDGNLWFRTTQPGGDDSRRLRIFERTQAAGLQTGAVNEYTIANVAAGAELRATLTWFDPESIAPVAVALINDLDLEVVAPNGDIYKGNVFAAGVSSTGGTADTRDTVEQVRLSAPAAGNYTFRVKASSVPGNGREETHKQGYALAVSGRFALPDPTPSAAPTSVAIAGNGSSGVSIGFTGSASQGFQLYRANGSCASAAAGDFRLIASGAASPVVDASTQGGRTYAYKVRGISDDVEGLVSSCVDIVSADECTLQPSISRDSLAVNAAHASCSVNLNWQPATGTCGTSNAYTYSVLRSTDPFASNWTTIASNLNSASYVDATVESGTAYFYRFQATDNLGNPSQLSLPKAATPTGVGGPNPDPFFDNADGVAYMQTEGTWGISNLAASDGSFSYHTGGQRIQYTDLTCESIETPPLTISSGASLNFNAKYNLEFEWDGVVTEISTDNGATWADLPPDGGYPAMFATGDDTGIINACGFANGKGIYSGVTTATSNNDADNDNAVAVFKPFAANLSSFAGQTVKIRWRLSSDPGLSYPGMFLDQIRIGTADRLFKDGFETSNYVCQ